MAKRSTTLSLEQKIEIQGLHETQQRLTRVIEALSPEETRPLLQIGILRLHRYMTGVVQVDTGRLKNSLHPFVEDKAAEIRTNVAYALPLEFMAGGKYSYIRRTAREEGPAVAQQVIIELQGEISGAFRS